MKTEVLKLVLTDEQKKQLKFIQECKAEKMRQYNEDYDEEVRRRYDDEQERFGLTPEERNR